MIPKRLYGPAQLAAAAATVYTVPAGRLAVIRNIHIVNPTAGDLTFTASIGADAAATRIFSAQAVSAEDAFDCFSPFVMNAGEILQAYASAAASLVITIDGEEELIA
ncbi:MAG: hypothetical protein WC083_07920 [Candidatus Methanomethylophilaceae archaeon]|jgi:hypothetical protein